MFQTYFLIYLSACHLSIQQLQSIRNKYQWSQLFKVIDNIMMICVRVKMGFKNGIRLPLRITINFGIYLHFCLRVNFNTNHIKSLNFAGCTTKRHFKIVTLQLMFKECCPLVYIFGITNTVPFLPCIDTNVNYHILYLTQINLFCWARTMYADFTDIWSLIRLLLLDNWN